jgi:hypothetical protein
MVSARAAETVAAAVWSVCCMGFAVWQAKLCVEAASVSRPYQKQAIGQAAQLTKQRTECNLTVPEEDGGGAYSLVAATRPQMPYPRISTRVVQRSKKRAILLRVSPLKPAACTTHL